MISQVFANKFIENSRLYNDYNFIIINPDGIIIAATEKDRVGDFHEASYRMMKNKEKIAVVEVSDIPHYVGVKCGVDMPILYKNEVVGAIGITGIPSKVKDVLSMARMSIETMLEYEFYKDELSKKRDSRKRFWEMLVEDNKSRADELIRYTIEQGYNPNRFRVAILIKIKEKKLSFSSFEDMMYASDLLNPEDILLYTDGKGYIIFRDIPAKEERLFQDYKNILRVFLVTLSTYFQKFGITFHAYIGSIQNRMENYFHSYRHCRWMQEKRLSNAFFYDYLQDYIYETMPFTIIDGIFNVTETLLDNQMRKNCVSLLRTLMDHNYNISNASAAMYIHKNTFNFRFNKIKEYFGISPLQNDRDKKFAETLCYYLEQKNDRQIHS